MKKLIFFSFESSNERERAREKERERESERGGERNRSIVQLSRILSYFCESSNVGKVIFLWFDTTRRKNLSFPKPRAERCKPYKAVLIVAIKLPVEWNSNSIS